MTGQPAQPQSHAVNHRDVSVLGPLSRKGGVGENLRKIEVDLEHEWFSSPVLGFTRFPSGIWQQPDKVTRKQLLLGFNQHTNKMETKKKLSSSSVPFLGFFVIFVALVSGSVHQPSHFRENHFTSEPRLTSGALVQAYQRFRSETFKVWSVRPLTFALPWDCISGFHTFYNCLVFCLHFHLSRQIQI